MIRALVWKELRETAGIAGIFLALAFVYLTSCIGWELFSLIRVLSSFSGYGNAFAGIEFEYAVLGCALAMALGFRQSVGETARGTALFLFHRPLSRSTIMLTKLAVGAGLLVTVFVIPVLAFAWWVATPGHFCGPFDWSMTDWTFRVVFLFAPLVYLSGFSSGIYAARWFGSRLLPLLAVLPALILLIDVLWSPLWAVPVTVLMALWFTNNILSETNTRDY